MAVINTITDLLKRFRLDDMLLHITGDVASDMIFGGRKTSAKDGKINSLSYEDNAIVLEVLAAAAEQFFSFDSPLQRLANTEKFLNLLGETAEKFQLKKTDPEIIWQEFLTFIVQNLPNGFIRAVASIAIGESLESYFTESKKSLNATQIERLSESIKQIIGYPYVKMILNLDKDNAMQAVKRFSEKEDHNARLIIFSPYLNTIMDSLSNPRSPLIVWPNLMRYLYDNTDNVLREKLEKKAETAIKHASRHISVGTKKDESIQWLSLAYIEMLKEFALRNKDEAVKFIKQLCELPDNHTRRELLMSVMGQPTHPVDKAIETGSNVADFVKKILAPSPNDEQLRAKIESLLS